MKFWHVKRVELSLYGLFVKDKFNYGSHIFVDAFGVDGQGIIDAFVGVNRSERDCGLMQVDSNK